MSAIQMSAQVTVETGEDVYDEEIMDSDGMSDDDDDDDENVEIGEMDLPTGMSIPDDSLAVGWDNTLLQPGDSTRTNVLSYEDSLIIDRLAHIPTVIEMPLNNITRQYIDKYCNRLRHSVEFMLGAGNFYFPIFEQVLEQYGLPLELKYLPVIESALKPTVVSHAGAAGLWQFMIATGKHYGLEVNTLVDERCDPLKASHAAAQYLKDLYDRFGDWSLAIAAYNCGEGNVNKAIIRAGVQEPADFWSIYSQLPRETRGYVPAFIAATYIMNYYCLHGITPMEATLPEATDTLVVKDDVSFSQIASKCQLSVEQLRSLNPQYRRDIIPMHYVLRLPTDDINTFLLYEDSIYNLRGNNTLIRRRVTGDIIETTPVRTVAKRTTNTYSRRRKNYVTPRKTAPRSRGRKTAARARRRR